MPRSLRICFASPDTAAPVNSQITLTRSSRTLSPRMDAGKAALTDDRPPAVAHGYNRGAFLHHEVGNILSGVAQSLDGHRHALQGFCFAGEFFQKDFDRHHGP